MRYLNCADVCLEGEWRDGIYTVEPDYGERFDVVSVAGQISVEDGPYFKDGMKEWSTFTKTRATAALDLEICVKNFGWA